MNKSRELLGELTKTTAKYLKKVYAYCRHYLCVDDDVIPLVISDHKEHVVNTVALWKGKPINQATDSELRHALKFFVYNVCKTMHQEANVCVIDTMRSRDMDLLVEISNLMDGEANRFFSLDLRDSEQI